MNKKITNKLKEQKVKEREKERSGRVEGTQFNQVKRAIQRKIENEDRPEFNEAWSVTFIRTTGERFHNNFKAWYQTHPLGYMGFGLGVTSTRQTNVRQQRRQKMQLVGHFLAKLQPSTQVLYMKEGLGWVFKDSRRRKI